MKKIRSFHPSKKIFLVLVPKVKSTKGSLLDSAT